MLWNYAKQVLERLSFRAVSQRLDKRKLQQEIDTHRLFLLTSYHSKVQTGALAGAQLAEELAAGAENMNMEEMMRAVQDNLLRQIRHISSSLHSALLLSGDQAEAAQAMEELAAERRESSATASTSVSRPQELRRGLAAAVGGIGSGAARAEAQPPERPPQLNAETPQSETQLPQGATRHQRWQQIPRLSMEDLSRLLQEKLGYTLRVSPSAQAGGDSGEGLWLEGRAQLGSVVALYPGLVYTPLMYRKIPGYPRIDQGNDYLMARFDGAVLDAQPWGRGGGLPLPTSAVQHRTPADQIWQRQVEMRHPLALAHFANHPSEGYEPNVMVAAFDNASQPDEAASARAYLPNVMVRHGREEAQISDPDEAVSGLALVATRPLEDEEILLNYRLSTHVARPAWYKPVDEQEDRRRWA